MIVSGLSRRRHGFETRWDYQFYQGLDHQGSSPFFLTAAIVPCRQLEFENSCVLSPLDHSPINTPGAPIFWHAGISFVKHDVISV